MRWIWTYLRTSGANLFHVPPRGTSDRIADGRFMHAQRGCQFVKVVPRGGDIRPKAFLCGKVPSSHIVESPSRDSEWSGPPECYNTLAARLSIVAQGAVCG